MYAVYLNLTLTHTLNYGHAIRSSTCIVRNRFIHTYDGYRVLPAWSVGASSNRLAWHPPDT